LKLSLKLTNGEKILLEVVVDEWDAQGFHPPVNLDECLDDVAALHRVLANATRVKMLRHLAEARKCRFSDMIKRIRVNRKILNDHLRMMCEEGLISRVKFNPRNVTYQPSTKGVMALLMCMLMANLFGKEEPTSHVKTRFSDESLE